jgi:hypothetical protein
MTAKLIDGKAIAELRESAQALRGRQATWPRRRVGADLASQIACATQACEAATCIRW